MTLPLDTPEVIAKWLAKPSSKPKFFKRDENQIMGWLVAPHDIDEAVRLMREAGWDCSPPNISKMTQPITRVLVAFSAPDKIGASENKGAECLG